MTEQEILDELRQLAKRIENNDPPTADYLAERLGALADALWVFDAVGTMH